MSDRITQDLFELEDLDLGELTVTSLRDTVALPENGASRAGSSTSCSSSSCAYPETPNLPN